MPTCSLSRWVHYVWSPSGPQPVGHRERGQRLPGDLLETERLGLCARDYGRVTWTFRNRIELRPGSRLQYGAPEWILDESEAGKQVKIVGRHPRDIPVFQALQEGIEAVAGEVPAAPIKDVSRLILTGIGYDSEAEAMAAGELWRGRVMRAFAILYIGADFGDEDRPSGGVTPYGLAAIGRGKKVLDDPPRLWAYQADDEEPLFIVINPIVDWWISSPHERLEGALDDAIATGGLSRMRQVSYGLYAGSFGLAPEPRFAMLMMAFESLLTLKPRSAESQAHVTSMMEATRASGLSASEVQSICGTLQWLLNQSIGQAGRDLAGSLGLRDYLNGEAPEKFFTKCYAVRSRLVHGKHPVPAPGELGQLAAPLEHLIGELIARIDA